MRSDLIVTLVIIGLFAWILHLKSHLKFILLGLFVGLVLDQTVAQPIDGYLTRNFSNLNHDSTLNIVELVLLLLPALILGINHIKDKKHQTLGQVIIYSVITSLLLLASILYFLPETPRTYVTAHSTIAFELVQFQTWLVGLGALVVVAESFVHKKQMSKVKKSKH